MEPNLSKQCLCKIAQVVDDGDKDKDENAGAGAAAANENVSPE